MDGKTTTLRIDEILVFEGLVSEAQVQEALDYQKQHGGRLGSHLMRLGYVEEAGLLKALEKQYGCQGINLSGLDIPEIVLKFIPAQLALARMVIPFAYDAPSNTLKIACENPSDKNLIAELQCAAHGAKVELFITPEIALKAVIAKYYFAPGEQTDVSEHAPSGTENASEAEAGTEVSPLNEDSMALDVATDETGSGSRRFKGTVLMVTDDHDADRPLKQAMEQAFYEVITSDSADDAIDMIGDKEFHTVFIRDTVPGDYLDLIDRLRKTSPSTKVRYFESAAELLMDEKLASDNANLLIKNLDLLTSLLVSKEKLESNHSGKVGQYADRLCRRLGLPQKDRLAITNAAYLHNLARFYYGNSNEPGYDRKLISLSAKLLDSLNYSPLVIGILRSMYKNLGGRYTKRLPIEALGGNIVTVADIFCENIPLHEKLALDQFERIKQKFGELVGKLFMEEVADAFLKMIQEDILKAREAQISCQVMIFSENRETGLPLEQRLKEEGFGAVVQHDAGQFVGLFTRSQPDFLIILKAGERAEVSGLVDALTAQGIDITSVPTFLLTESVNVGSMTPMLERGVEDIIALDDNLDLLIAKMKKMKTRLDDGSTFGNQKSRDTGTRGSLADMNLIDLLQAMGPSRKTVKMVLSSNAEELTLYLDKGNIVFAQHGDKTGAEAVYDGISWNDGAWRVEPISTDALPEPNNEYSNESILMEGCRLLDESRRTTREEVSKTIS